MRHFKAGRINFQWFSSDFSEILGLLLRGCHASMREMGADGPPDIDERAKSLSIEPHDVKLDRDEFQRIFKWNENSNRNPGIFNDMLLHGCLLTCAETSDKRLGSLQTINDVCDGPLGELHIRHLRRQEGIRPENPTEAAKLFISVMLRVLLTCS